MAIDEQLADRVTAFLNELLEVDRAAISQLVVDKRVFCNAALADHPTVQVGFVDGVGEYDVGLLGVLNGLCGAGDDGWGPIAAVVEETTGAVSSFRRVTPADIPGRNYVPDEIKG